MNEVEPLGMLNRDGFVLVLNPLGSINESCSEDKLYCSGETDVIEPEGEYQIEMNSC